MERRLVYDLPIRIFHWLFAALFVTAFFIGKTVDDDSPTFSYHMLAGMSLSFLVLLRLLWGFSGSRHAKFTGFNLNPRALVQYLKGILSGDKKIWKIWAGHNPASSWAALIMMTLGLSLGATGYLMVTSQSHETYGEIHELLANAFVLFVVLHVAGVIFHTLRHKDNLAFSMLDGRKQNLQAQDQISSSHPVVALFLLAFFAAFVINLRNGYDPQTQTLSLFGSVLQLGESEKGDHENHDGHSEDGKNQGEKEKDHNKEKNHDDDGDDD